MPELWAFLVCSQPAGELGAAFTKDGLIQFGLYNHFQSVLYLTIVFLFEHRVEV
jgi:hypothetical protein